MSAVTFDTHKYVKQLEAAGIASLHAEAFVVAQRDILSEALDTQLATKADIHDLRHEVSDLHKDMLALELRLTVKLGSIVVLALGAFTALSKWIG